MARMLWSYFKHVSLTFLVLALVVVVLGIREGASIGYAQNPVAMQWDREGPYVFLTDEGITVETIRGNRDDGYTVERTQYPPGTPFSASSHFALDGSSFELIVETDITTPPTVYRDDHRILAISDVESNYRALRDFLVVNGVIDEGLSWRFGSGHLVLVGDFVDRGFSTTQVLWFIYKLEQDARKHGGRVHFILGNHEIKNLQGNYQSASPKYFHVAAILGRQQFDLYGPSSFLGRWLASKNSIERINDHLFVHGGIHPDVAELGYSLDTLNQRIREGYRQAYFPRPDAGDEELLLSTKTGPSWYRGYFKDDLTLQEVERGLDQLGAEAVVVGHTIQRKVNKQYDGKVFAIDVKHPEDYNENFPVKRSEGLLIDQGRYYRVLDDGERIEL